MQSRNWCYLRVCVLSLFVWWWVIFSLLIFSAVLKFCCCLSSLVCNAVILGDGVAQDMPVAAARHDAVVVDGNKGGVSLKELKLLQTWAPEAVHGALGKALPLSGAGGGGGDGGAGGVLQGAEASAAWCVVLPEAG